MARVLGRNRNLILLFLVICLGALLRFWRLTDVPPSLFGDEVDVGYQAYSILKTGKDYMGQSWPISFHSLAEWRTPLFIYATVPFVWLFGLTEFGVRFAPALFGVLTIPVFYLLIKELFAISSTLFENPSGLKSSTRRVKESAGFLGLIAALLLAISPWHLQYSRAAFEVTQMLFLILLGVWGFLRGLRDGKWLILAAFCFALAPYSYNTAKLFIPLFVVLLGVIFLGSLRKIEKKKIGVAVLVFILVSLPMIDDIFLGQGGARFSYLSIFSDPTTAPEIGFKRLEDLRVKLEEVPLGATPSFSSKFFHNKFLSWGTTFLTNYFHSFSTEFLFTFGDINYRHSIQGGFGELYWLDAPFLLLGVFWVFSKMRVGKEKLFLLGWLLLAPVPSALTRDGGNHATRLILMLPPLLIFISLGILGMVRDLGKKGKIIFSFLLFTFYLLLFVLYLHRYYIHWPLDSEGWWHPGFKQAGQYVLEHQNEYGQIVWSNSGEPPQIFFLFWTNFPPEKFQKAEFRETLVNNSISARLLDGTKFYFGTLDEKFAKNYNYEGALTSKILYIMPKEEIHTDLRRTPLPKGLKLLKIINFPSGEPVMYLFTGV
jgi:4-amino-4-deoxy-L-arabinose transferase-like glycosyltransferase